MTRVYLVLPLTVSETVKLDSFTLTTPSGIPLTDAYGRRFKAGYLHLSRTDGRAWPSGSYVLALRLTTSAGAPFTAQENVTVPALSTPSAAEPVASTVLGTNGRLLP